MSNITQKNETTLSDLLKNRWSPRSFNGDTEISKTDLKTLLEAARWTPSASNIQPWRFVVGARGTQIFNTIMGSLSRGNSSWAGSASALILAISVKESADGNIQRWAEYDLGQAVAHLSLQAHMMGYHAHQMGGFDIEALRRDFSLEDRYEPMSIIAIGEVDTPDKLPERYQEKEKAPRVRESLDEIVLCGLSD